MSCKYTLIALALVAMLGGSIRATTAAELNQGSPRLGSSMPSTNLFNHQGTEEQQSDQPDRFSVEQVRVRNFSGVMLAGTLFKAPNADQAVVLAHSFVRGQNQIGLHPLAEELVRNGITALAFDFQGRGLTGGSPRYAEVHTDVMAIIGYLRDLGYDNIASLGVGLGGFGSAKNGPALNGLITISIPPVVNNRLGLDESDLSSPYPKLFISAEHDYANGRPFAQYAIDLYDIAVEPKQLKIYSGNYHSMELFHSSHAADLNNLIVEFFGDLSGQK